MNRNAAVAGDFSDALLQTVQRQIDATVDVPGGPFAWISDIQQQRRVCARQLLCYLVFSATPDRYFRAFDDRDGKVLWKS